MSPRATSLAVVAAALVATGCGSPAAPSRGPGPAPAPSRPKSVMIVAPHPDDEVLTSAGRIFSAVAAGDAVTVVVVTNGDAAGGTLRGYERQGESVDALALLGVDEEHVVFLGYGNGSLRQLYDSDVPGQVYRSVAGRSQTYGNRGAGGVEYHRLRHGAHAPYSRESLVSDLVALLTEHRPDELYTVAANDDHPDHQATALFVTEALASLRRSGVELPTRLYETLVWKRCGVNWPDAGGLTPSLPYGKPPCLDATPLDWSEVVRFPLAPAMSAADARPAPWGARARAAARCAAGTLSRPAETLSTGSRLRLASHDLKACARGFVGRVAPGAHLKLAALRASSGGGNPFYLSFVRADEFFWMSDVGRNVAFLADVTASSEDVAHGRGAMKAIDGKWDGGPRHEWATTGEAAGAWIQLTWPAPVVVDRITLRGLTSTPDRLVAGKLTFSDGQAIRIGALPANGAGRSFPLPSKRITWVRLTVDEAQGARTGLAEIEVLGTPVDPRPSEPGPLSSRASP